MHSGDNQPRQDEESSQVEHTNGWFVVLVYEIPKHGSYV